MGMRDSLRFGKPVVYKYQTQLVHGMPKSFGWVLLIQTFLICVSEKHCAEIQQDSATVNLIAKKYYSCGTFRYRMS